MRVLSHSVFFREGNCRFIFLLSTNNVRVKLSYLDTDVAIFLFPDSSTLLHLSLARNKTSEISKIISHVFPKISHVFSFISEIFPIPFP